MRYFLLILTILSFISCKLTKGNVVGHYRDHANFESSAYLQLNPDYSYEFKQQTGLVFFKGKGNWSIASDTLKLLNNDTSLLNGTPIPQQVFLIKRTKLVEVTDDKHTGLKLKRS